MTVTNIVLIVVDQLRADIAYHESYRYVRTPNIDHLRQDGVTLRRAFCQYPVCAPSRATIVTGRYPQQNGIVTNRCILPPDERTIGHHFGDLGYDVIALGKTHGQSPGFSRRPEPLPLAETVGSEYWGFYKGQGTLGAASPTAGNTPEPLVETFEGKPATHYDRQINQQLRHFLDSRSQGRPFLSWVAYHSPHPPLIPPPHLRDLYPVSEIELLASATVEAEFDFQRSVGRSWAKTPEDVRLKMVSAYLQMVTHVDECIGELVSDLNVRGLLDDTLIMLTSDHGEQLGEHGLLGKFNNFFDSSVRVPLVLRLPQGHSGGAELSSLVELVDIYPTACDLVGVPAPVGLSGRSFSKVVDNPTLGHREYVSSMFIENAAHVAEAPSLPGDFVHGQMIRTDRWKLALYPGRGGELYDLEADPHEVDNLFASPSHLGTRVELYDRMLEHRILQSRRPSLSGLNHFPG
jgi:arylsulfatase A-like enzyme